MKHRLVSHPKKNCLKRINLKKLLPGSRYKLFKSQEVEKNMAKSKLINESWEMYAFDLSYCMSQTAVALVISMRQIPFPSIVKSGLTCYVFMQNLLNLF